MEVLPQNSNLPVLMKNRPFCQTAEELVFFVILWIFPGCAAFAPPPPLSSFLRENWVLSITHAIAANSLRLVIDRPWMVFPPTSHPPSLPPPLTCHSLLSLHSTSRSSFWSLLPSVGCYCACISQTLPLRPVNSWAGRKSKGSSASCESNPTHLCVFDSG